MPKTNGMRVAALGAALAVLALGGARAAEPEMTDAELLAAA